MFLLAKGKAKKVVHISTDAALQHLDRSLTKGKYVLIRSLYSWSVLLLIVNDVYSLFGTCTNMSASIYKCIYIYRVVYVLIYICIYMFICIHVCVSNQSNFVAVSEM